MVEVAEMAALNFMPQKGSDQLVFIGGGLQCLSGYIRYGKGLCSGLPPLGGPKSMTGRPKERLAV